MRLLGLAGRIATTPRALKAVQVVQAVQARRYASHQYQVSDKVAALTVTLDLARGSLPELQVSTATPSFPGHHAQLSPPSVASSRQPRRGVVGTGPALRVPGPPQSQFRRRLGLEVIGRLANRR
jgi:hypothetical protein